MTSLSIHLLGALQVTLNDKPVTRFEYDKVRALLVYLAVEAGRPHRRDALMALLWPDMPEKSARTNLRQVLSILRRALAAGHESTDTASSPYLVIDRETVQFSLTSDSFVDVNCVESLLEACDRHPHRHAASCRICAGKLRQAVQLYRGPFLAEFFLPDSAQFEEWALLKREWLHRRMSEALGRLVVFHESQGDYDQALALARQQLNLDPWREEAHRQVMRLLLLKGDRNAALDQYERCRAVLAEELSVEPEADTAALYQHIRSQEAGSLIDPDALALPAERPHTLPPQPTPFVGREQELEQINGLFNRQDVRLISLVGPGGSGKTRLALQAAIEQLDTFKDGVYFVPLVSASSAEHLPGLIAGAVGCELSGTVRQDQQLLDFLERKDLLLILDNFEHLIQASDLLVQIMTKAPDVTLAVTSRERLNLPGEWVFSVPGMTVPGLPENEELNLEQVESIDAVRLFLQSAARAHSGFHLDVENSANVVKICRLVAGLPLALELAASWVRVLSAGEIAEEIEKSLHFLSTSSRGFPERQRSLTAVFDHTWSLLSQEEVNITRRLSVFEGSFSRQAAETVAGAALPLLAALVDKSVIQRSPAGRYKIHDLLRQYAQEKLAEAGETHDARNRHAAYFREMAETSARQAAGVYQKEWLQKLEAEHANLRLALDWSLRQQVSENGMRLAVSLYRFWYWRSHFQEGSYWLGLILESQQDVSSKLYADAAYSAGVLASEQDNYADARNFLQKSLDVRQQLGDRRAVASSLNSLGLLAWSERAYSEAITLLEECLALQRELGEEGDLAKPLNSLGLVALAQGDLEKAKTYFTESLHLARSRNDQMGIATTLSNLAAVQLDLDQPHQALKLFREALDLFAVIGDKEGIAWCLEGIGSACVSQGQVTRGAKLGGCAAALREQIHAPLTPTEEVRYNQTIATARQELGEAGLAEAVAAGQAMSLPEAIQLAKET